jgi:hypothetical protein
MYTVFSNECDNYIIITTIWITLVVGWKKRKRRDGEVNVNLIARLSSHRNSNLWIDENDGRGNQK